MDLDRRVIIDFNINASRIPAARPEGSLFAVSGFLSFCVRKFEEKEADEEEEEEANNKKKMKDNF